MATTYKRVSLQGSGAIGTYGTLYFVPASTQAVVSTIAVSNSATSSGTFRIGFDTAEGTPDATEWLVYGASVPANDTTFISIGMGLQAGQYIRVSSSATTISFNAFLAEVT